MNMSFSDTRNEENWVAIFLNENHLNFLLIVIQLSIINE